MSSDLHMHTTYSDGRLTPEELVDAAKAAGLTYMAITDHDTVEGISHLYEMGRYPCKAIHIIPGIEFSAHHPLREIHILGYNIDIYYGPLVDKLNDVTEARWTRFAEMLEKLRQGQACLCATLPARGQRNYQSHQGGGWYARARASEAHRRRCARGTDLSERYRGPGSLLSAA